MATSVPPTPSPAQPAHHPQKPPQIQQQQTPILYTTTNPVRLAQTRWEQLPEELLVHVMLRTPHPETFALQTGALVCKSWKSACLSNLLWDHLCLKLWKDKVFVPKMVTEMSDKKRAYMESLEDAKRGWISKEELVSFTWNFRFKAAAGEHWIESDPWWQGKQEVVTVRFNMDGSVSGRGQMHVQNKFRWKFIVKSCGKVAPMGTYVRVNSFPAYNVRRHPKNWGWVMENCWVVLTAFPMPPKGADPLLEDESLTVTVEMQAQEAMTYNAAVSRLVFSELGDMDEDEPPLENDVQELMGGGDDGEYDDGILDEEDDDDEDDGDIDEYDDDEDTSDYYCDGPASGRSVGEGVSASANEIYLRTSPPVRHEE